MKRGLIIILIFGIILVSLGFVNATEYYISSSEGIDTNNGLSSSTPFFHHPWDANAGNTADSTTLQPGDIVYMKKGDVWYDVQITVEDSGNTSQQIITTTKSDFGSGDNPKLYGSYNYSSLSFDADGGSYTETGLTTEPNIVIYNGTVLTENDTATNTVLSNQWDWNASNQLWVNVGEDPDNGIILIGKRDYVLYSIAGDYFTFENIDFLVANTVSAGNVFINGRTGANFTNCTVQYSPYYNLYFYQTVGGVVSNCNLTHWSGVSVQNVYINDDDSGTTIFSGNIIKYGFYGIRIAACGNKITLQNNTISNTTNRPVYIINSGCFSCEIFGNEIYNYSSYGISIGTGNGNLVVRENTIYDGTGGIITQSDNGTYSSNIISNILTGFSILDSDNNSINSNIVYDAWNGLYYGGGGDGTGIYVSGSSEGNEIYKNNISSSYVGISYNSDSGNGGDRIYYNLLRDSIVNGISLGNDGGVGFTESYNNLVIHNPSENNDAAYTGHGLVAQVSISRVKFANNLIIVEPNYPSAPSNSNGLAISNTGSNIIEALTDYNHLDLKDTTYGYAFKHNSTQMRTLSSWLLGIQLDSKIKDLNGVFSQAGDHTSTGDSGIVNLEDNNFSLQWNSSLIDAGTDLNFTIDYLGNPIYGAPDIGAYEYQPPYNITSDLINTSVSKNIRIYKNGKFRYVNYSTSNINANLTVQPNAGFNSSNYSHFLDVNVTTWTSSLMNWSEYSSDSGLNSNHSVCGLASGSVYQVYYTKNSVRSLISRYTADSDGCIKFDYSYGYSTIVFDISPYVAASSTDDTTSSGSGKGTYKPSKSSLENGFSVNVIAGQKVQITYSDGKTKIVEVESVDEEKVVVSVEGIDYEIGSSASVKIDLDDDGFYDVEISNKKVYSNGIANLEFKLINEEVPAGEEKSNIGKVIDGVSEAVKNIEWYVYVIIGVVIVLIVVGIVLKRKK